MIASGSEIEAAGEHVYAAVSPTPQIVWPLLCERAGCEVWVKHENHLPTGAFKVRGGLVFAAALDRPRGLIAATRGNHGQSVAFAARRIGVSSTIVVPHGNSPEKNAAMRAWGARLVEHGHDFDEALPHASELAEREGLELVPSVHPLLVRGVATAGVELLTEAGELDAVYVPIGLGSGILAMISAREALGHRTEIIGVVSERADAYARSFEAREVRTTDSADTFADGLAVRVPDALAVEAIQRHAARVVRVGEDEIRAAIRHLVSDSHQIAEGAGAASFAALLSERDRMQGKRVAVLLTGGNIDRDRLAGILAESNQTGGCDTSR